MKPIGLIRNDKMMIGEERSKEELNAKEVTQVVGHAVVGDGIKEEPKKLILNGY
jgi:hypothetical protein